MGKKESLGWTPPATDSEEDDNSQFTPPASDIEDGTEKKNSQPESLNSNSPSASSTSASSSDGFKQGKYELPEGFQNFDIKSVTNQPEEVVKANQRKQMEQRFRPEAVKQADQKIKEVDSKIVDVSRQWNEIKKAQDQNIVTLKNLKDQLEDPMVPDDQKKQLAGIFQQTYDSAVSTEESEKKVRESAIKLQQAKSTLKKVYEVQEKLDMDENDDFLKATGNFLSHVYNALPETISGAGSLVESFGDVLKHPFDFGGPSTDYATAYEQFKEDQKDDKITDVIGKAIQGMGNDMKAETDAKYDDKHYISSTIGDIVGSIAVSAIPGSIAAKAGKAAQIVTGATTATMQMADGVHTKAKELGLSDEDAGVMTLSIAPISGLLEVWGASNIIDNVSGKKIINELITESTKKLAGQKITKELIFETVGDTFKDVAKKYGLNAVKSAGEEGITEGAQQAVQDAAENIYDLTQDKDVYGTKFFSKETLVDVAKNAALGMAAGGVFGTISGISSPKSIYENAIELKQDPERLAQFREGLNTEVAAGHITEDEATNIRSTMNAMMDADEKIPPEIKDKDKRFKAVELIQEKTKLEEEIKGMDKAITAPQRERIKEINSDLELIATGKERVVMERKPLNRTNKPVKEAAAAVEETAAQAEALVPPNPLSSDEKSELMELERDKRRIGLDEAEQKRYDELKVRDLPVEQTKMDFKQSKEDFVAEQKGKLKADDSFSEEMDKDGTYDRIFGHKYELANIREERLTEEQQNEENDVKPITEEDHEQIRTEFDEQPESELKTIEPSTEAIEREAENTGELIRAASDEGKALPEADIDKLITEQTELSRDTDHVLRTPARKKKTSRITKILAEKPSTVREAALHYFLEGGQVRKADAERMMGSNFSKEDWGKNSKLLSDKAPAMDMIAKERISEMMGRELSADEQDQVMQELADITLNKSNKNLILQEAKQYREEKSAEKDRQEMNASLSSESSTEKSVKAEPTLKDEGAVKDYEGDVPFQRVLKSEKFTKSQKRITKSITNVVKALAAIAPDLKVVIHETEESFAKANEASGSAGKNVKSRGFYLSKDNEIHINLPIAKNNTLFHEGTHPILNMVEDMRPGTIDAMFNDLIGIEKKLKLEHEYTQDFASLYGEDVRKMEAITEFIADVAAVKVKVDESNIAKIRRFFAKLLNVLGIKIKGFDSENIISLAKKIQNGFEKGELIDIETNRSLREIVFGKYDQKTLAAIELEKQIASAESELKAAEKAFDKKRKELDTEIINDQEDLFGERKSTAAGGGGLFDERVDTSARNKVIEPFKVRVDKAKEHLSSLKEKLKGEEGKSDLTLFQMPENTDNISEEDILWALKTFKKLGNDYEKFRTKLSSTEEGRDLLQKNLFGAMLEYNSEKPQASTKDRLKALSDNLQKSDYITPELKEKIEENGLRSEVFHHEEARAIADIAIKALGVDGALDLAEKRLKGSVRAFVYGAAIDYYATKEAAATNTFEKDSYAQKGADIAEQFQKDAEDYGRFISAIGDYYKSSPLIIQKTETNKLRTKAKEALERMKSSVKKVKSVDKEFNNTAKRDIPPPKEKTPRKTMANPTVRAAKRTELLDRWKALQSKQGQQQVAGYTQEQIDIMVEMGTIHVADGAWAFPDWYRKMKADLGISEKTAREVWEKEKMPAELDAAERTLSKMITEDLGDTEEYKKQQEKILNKYFPKKRLESENNRKEEHEKIIEQYNAGVFGDGKNPEGEEFKSLFFNKLGIVNPDAPEIQARIGEFAQKISSAPDGSVMQREAQEDLLTYIAKIAYRTRLASGASKLSSIWYANILSSPATHLRNIQYNAITTAISQPFLLAEKAILNKDYKAIPTHMRGIIEGFKKGLVESGRVMKTGRSSRFDNVTALSELERGKYIKPFVVPGRALKASDIFFTDAAYNMKLSELARQLVIKENPTYTEDQISGAVNELLGNTQERKDAAAAQAEKEMAAYYGPDWQTQKGLSSVYKIRQFEIMEASIPADMKEEASKWSKKSLLTNRPTGVLGVLADKINGLNQQIYFTKFVMPFVNVPFNLVNAMVDRSPFGLIKAIRRAEGWGGFKEELSDNEVKELYIKIANYAVATVALSFMNGDGDDDPLVITGAQTGDYMDNKGVIHGGGLEPYTLYIGGKKILSYKTTPWAAALLVPGYIRDAKLYAKSEGAKDIAAYTGLNWLLFINDQSAMQGVQGLVSTLAEAKKTTSDLVMTTLAKYAQNMIVPYSGALKFFNNNTKAVLGENDNRPIDPWEYLTKDVPFVDQVSRTRKDHFGQDVKESFDVPLVPIGQRGVVEAMSDVSPYYSMCKDQGYFPTFSTQRKMFVEGKELQISKKDLDDVNTARGQIVAQALDSKNVFVPKDEDEVDEKIASMTTMEYLKTLDKDEFKKRMDDLFAEATKLARIRKYGDKVGITPKDIDKAKKMAEENGEDIEYRKQTANQKLQEEYNEKGTVEIAVDAY